MERHHGLDQCRLRVVHAGSASAEQNGVGGGPARGCRYGEGTDVVLEVADVVGRADGLHHGRR
eukprot:4286305-Pleurochrysis_carterae.AAC.1